MNGWILLILSHSAAGRAAVVFTFARKCTGTTFVLMRSVCCRRWKAKDVLLAWSWLKHSDWLR